MKTKEAAHVSLFCLILTACGGGYNAPEAWQPLTVQGTTREQALNYCLFEAEKAGASAGSGIADRVTAFISVRSRCMAMKGFYASRP